MPPRYDGDYHFDGSSYTNPTGSRSSMSRGYNGQAYLDASYSNDDRRPRVVGDAVPPEFYSPSLGHVGGSEYTHVSGYASQGHSQSYEPFYHDSAGPLPSHDHVRASEDYQEYSNPNDQFSDPNMHPASSGHQYDSQPNPRGGPNRSESIICAEHPAVISTLDPRYVLQPRSYYSPGKIFAILWHENFGVSNGTGNGTVVTRGPTFTGRFNELIYSAIRRMVVFSTNGNNSFCFPISTYGNRGVAKRNVNPNTHAIVYLRGTPPFQAPNEPRMIKEPLEVAAESRDETIHHMSRLDFGKIHTVEHNVKVLPIGRITSRSMTRFIQYTRDEMRSLV